MDRNEVIALAREAGFHCYNGCVDGIDADLERIFRAAFDAGAAAERQECAKIVDGNADACSGLIEQILRSNAAAIRARKDDK